MLHNRPNEPTTTTTTTTPTTTTTRTTTKTDLFQADSKKGPLRITSCAGTCIGACTTCTMPQPVPNPWRTDLRQNELSRNLCVCMVSEHQISFALTNTNILKTHFCKTVYLCMVPETQIPFALTKISISKKTLSENHVFLYGFRTLDFICAYNNNGFEKHVFVKPYVCHTFRTPNSICTYKNSISNINTKTSFRKTIYFCMVSEH